MRIKWLALVAILVHSVPAAAQVRWGPQVGYVGVGGFGVGVRAHHGLNTLFGVSEGFASRLEAAAGLDYYFVEDVRVGTFEQKQSYWEITLLASHPFAAAGRAVPYLGGGLNIGRFGISQESDGRESGGSSTEMGLNALAGIRFGDGAPPLFVELRLSSLRFITFGGRESSGLYLTAGLRL